MSSTLFYPLVTIAAILGLFLSLYIRHKKANKKVLVCPLKANCDDVIHSEYSKFFGIPVELMGMGYYILVALIYTGLQFQPDLIPASAILWVLGLTATALLFSLYLTIIQAIVLRQWCSWCLMSAGLCATIFYGVVAGSTMDVLAILAEYKFLILIFHNIGFALGLGGAVMADFFFFRFLKDLKISEDESKTLSMVSEVVWFGLALLVISGIGLYLPEMARLNESGKFLVKMIVVAVIIINGVFLNLKISPQLVKISFGGKHKHKMGELRGFRKLAFALGAVSITSWFAAFILGIFRSVPLSFIQLLSIYVIAIGIAVSLSQILEIHLTRKSNA
jgi:uncharacterized membrane protein